MSQREWVYESFAAYEAWATRVWDGSNSYQLMTPCERCECELARVDPDADYDGEGNMRDQSGHYCAGCGDRIGRGEVDDDASIDALKGAIAASMFRGFHPVTTAIMRQFDAAIAKLQ